MRHASFGSIANERISFQHRPGCGEGWIGDAEEDEASTMWTAFIGRMGRFCAALFIAAAGLYGQVSAPPPLVHLYPVILDSKGQPVTDLTASDFKIADQGKSQTILLFRRWLTSISRARRNPGGDLRSSEPFTFAGRSALQPRFSP